MKKLKFVMTGVENILWKGENVGDQHFVLSHNVFPKTSNLWLLKSGLCGEELILYQTIPCFNEPEEEAI